MSSPSQFDLFELLQQEAEVKFGTRKSLKAQQWTERSFRERGGKFIPINDEEEEEKDEEKEEEKDS